jgi:CRISPR-associated protein Cmr1
MTKRELKTYQVTFRVISPLYLGGADPAKPEWRLASLKGVWRFWWRAWAWNHYAATAAENRALAAIQQSEGSLFGSTEVTQGQSRIWLKWSQPPPVSTQARLPAGKGLQYLGYPVKDRSAFKPVDVQVTVGIVGPVDPTLESSFWAAVKLWGLLGGLGARSRRGFGSVTVTRIEGDRLEWRRPTNVDQYREALVDLLGPHSRAPLPPYAAFSNTSRIDWVDQDNNPEALLDRLGIRLQEYAGALHRSPRLAMLGLPKSHLRATDLPPRLATPLWFHLLELNPNDCRAVVMRLPSRVFDGLHVSAKPWPDWSVLDEFVERYPASERVSIWP